MNTGRAVIVSDQVGCGPDLEKNGKNGCIFKAGKIEDLYRALRDVLANPERYRAIGQKSLDMINTWGFEEGICGLKKGLDYVMERKEDRSAAKRH